MDARLRRGGLSPERLEWERQLARSAEVENENDRSGLGVGLVLLFVPLFYAALGAVAIYLSWRW